MDGIQKQYSCNYSLIPRRIPSQNIINRLARRETFGAVKHGTHFHVAREFHQ
ncbi:hypothetical protein L9F63_005080, partial [Diploptera punctata]